VVEVLAAAAVGPSVTEPVVAVVVGALDAVGGLVAVAAHGWVVSASWSTSQLVLLVKVSATYKEVAAVLLVADGTVGAAKLVLVVVAAKVGEVASTPVQGSGSALAALLAGVTATAFVGHEGFRGPRKRGDVGNTRCASYAWSSLR
jgi:hypothetical protein